MSKKTATSVSNDTTSAPQENSVSVDILAAYQAKEAEAKASKRTVTAGRNVPYHDVKELIDSLAKALPGGYKEIDVAQAKAWVYDTLKSRYEAMPTGMDRTHLKVGMERVEMTLTEARELRLKQLEFSRKGNNIYRMVRNIRENKIS